MGKWDLARLGDVCKIAKTKYDGDLLPYVGMEHIESGTGRLVIESTPTAVKSATFRFNESHVLYGRLRPYLNKVFLPDFEGHCSTEIFPLECCNRLDRRFLFYWLTSEATVSRIDRTSTGARPAPGPACAPTRRYSMRRTCSASSARICEGLSTSAR